MKTAITRWVLKFDAGKSGFNKAIYVLVFSAIVVLFWGIYFIVVIFKPPI